MFAYANPLNPTDTIVWTPIPDFNRTDADVTVFFLSQNSVAYYTPVFDAWFLSSGAVNETDHTTNRTFFFPDYSVNIMACADQYALCNPSTSLCSQAGGLNDLTRHGILANAPQFNLPQMITAGRLSLAAIVSSTYESVVGVGGAAASLYASSYLQDNLSPGLPDDQWRREVLGWFQTGMVKLQAYMVEWAAKADGVEAFITTDSPYGDKAVRSKSAGELAALREACENQLVQTAGEVQNFSFAGVLVIACVSVLLIGTDLVLERAVDGVQRIFRKRGSVAVTARQADHRLHLLRMVLGEPDEAGNAWELGDAGVPVLRDAGNVRRPGLSGGLAKYHTDINGREA